MHALYSRARSILLATLLVYGLLVATHEGEFWPFSIYPMFSQAGNPWSRAVVREVPDAAAVPWTTVSSFEALPGTPFPLAEYGIDPIDLANFVSKTETWDVDRLDGLRTMFYDRVDQQDLLVVRVNGRLAGQDTVALEYVPYVLMRTDTTALNPSLASR